MTRLRCSHDWLVVDPCPECGTDALTPADALLQARYQIERLVDEFSPEPGEQCGEYPALCTACIILDSARAFLVSLGDVA